MGSERRWGSSTSTGSKANASVYLGIVKSFDMAAGWGSIECEEAHQIYGMDVSLSHHQLAGHRPRPGDPLQFSVVVGAEGYPEATDVSFQRTQPQASPFSMFPQAAGMFQSPYQQVSNMQRRGSRYAPY